MTTSKFNIHTFKPDGSFDSTATCETTSLDAGHIQFFAEQFKHLSNDIELPLEGKLPEDSQFIEFRIACESANAAFVLYYFHDENVHISLLLRGEDEESEYELMQIIRCLLLSSDFDEDLAEEEIDIILDDERFDFEQFEEKPAIFNVTFQEEDATKEDVATIHRIEKMNRHLAVAFFDRPSK